MQWLCSTIAAIVHLVLVNLMLGASLMRYLLFAIGLLAEYSNKLQIRDWWLIGIFPRLVYCDSEITAELSRGINMA